MFVKLEFKKRLEDRRGQGQNGDYCFAVFIAEFEEETSAAPITHSVVVEVSDKRWKVAEIAKLVGTGTKVDANVSLDVRQYQGKYYNDVNVYIRDKAYMIPKEY